MSSAPTHDLLIPSEVDEMLRYSRGKAVRLARRGKLPAIFLPDGQVRFLRAQIEQLLRPIRRGESEAQLRLVGGADDR